MKQKKLSRHALNERVLGWQERRIRIVDSYEIIYTVILNDDWQFNTGETVKQFSTAKDAKKAVQSAICTGGVVYGKTGSNRRKLAERKQGKGSVDDYPFRCI